MYTLYNYIKSKNIQLKYIRSRSNLGKEPLPFDQNALHKKVQSICCQIDMKYRLKC